MTKRWRPSGSDRGNLETAQRVREAVQHVYQYTVDTGVLEPAQNFVNNRTGGLPTPRGRHYAAITDPQLLGQLLRDMRAYSGNFISVAALRLAPLVFQRPGQLRWHIGKMSISKRDCGAARQRTQQWADFLDELEAGKMPKLADDVLWSKQA